MNRSSTGHARVNRTGLAITGLVLILAGAAALAKGLGLLGAPGERVVSGGVTAFAARNAWFWPAVAVAALVIGLLALRWLFLQVRTSAIRHLDLEEDPGHGATHLSARAAAEAIEDDLAQTMHEPAAVGGQPTGHGRHGRHAPGERVRARLGGAPGAPSLSLAVVLPDESDPAAARQGIQRAVTRLRRSLETERLPATVRMHTVRTHH
ncbi:alkaline shock response membrane anchor protein AmaP [Sphaerisporangium dianthi]|uniref:Alkaline shock response membrane anchor protein AmaP n=1 Tax=Sphaerisporangium dianthi TaxID=1436120 RepID=A0ABV9CQJ8_9ACTN